MKRTICIAGKNNIAVDVVDFIKENYPQHDLLVVSNACDTGLDTWQKSLRKHAKENGIREIRLEEAQEIKDLIFISTEFDRIIKPKKFNSEYLYNIHFSLLPKYKGMHICLFHILNGESTAGVTFHQMDVGIDTGRIISQKSFAINEHDTARDLYLKLIDKGTDLVKDLLPSIISGEYKTYEQSYYGSTYNSKDAFSYTDFSIDLKQTAWMISRQIMALCFREYQMPEVSGYKVVDYEITKNRSNVSPGTVLKDEEFTLLLATIDYDIIIYKDKFGEIQQAIIEGDDAWLGTVPHLSCYKNEQTTKNETLIKLAQRLHRTNLLDLLR